MAIIALTLLVRALLLPLTLKQFQSMQSMARLQPEIKKLQEKYKDDKERLNQEMMKFYRENKVNPFASCLPMVAQLPVFISLYYMLRTDLRHDICPEVNPRGACRTRSRAADGGDAQFLFIPDLTDKATGGVLVVLIVLYVGSQLVSTLLMSTTTDKTQRMIFLALPFFFVHLRDPVPGRPARLLDHDEPVDDRAAGDHPQAPRARCDHRAPRQRQARSASCREAAVRGGTDDGEPATAATARSPQRARASRARRRQRSPRAAPDAARRRRRRGRRRSARGGGDERAKTRPAIGSANCSSTVARGARPRRRRRASSEDGEASAACSRATTSGCSSAATARRSTPCSTWRSRSPTATTGRAAACGSIVDAAGYRERREQVLQRQADAGRGATPSAPAARSRSTR